jgi:hypothetical protein
MPFLEVGEQPNAICRTGGVVYALGGGIFLRVP